MEIRSENEYLLIWNEILQRPIDMDEDLIAAGMDSIRATMLLSRIYDKYGVDVDLWDLLDGGTPRRVLDVIRGNGSKGVPSS